MTDIKFKIKNLNYLGFKLIVKKEKEELFNNLAEELYSHFQYSQNRLNQPKRNLYAIFSDILDLDLPINQNTNISFDDKEETSNINFDNLINNTNNETNIKIDFNNEDLINVNHNDDLIISENAGYLYRNQVQNEDKDRGEHDR